MSTMCPCGEHGKMLACPHVLLRDTPEDRERLAELIHRYGDSDAIIAALREPRT